MWKFKNQVCLWRERPLLSSLLQMETPTVHHGVFEVWHVWRTSPGLFYMILCVPFPLYNLHTTSYSYFGMYFKLHRSNRNRFHIGSRAPCFYDTEHTFGPPSPPPLCWLWPGLHLDTTRPQNAALSGAQPLLYGLIVCMLNPALDHRRTIGSLTAVTKQQHNCLESPGPTPRRRGFTRTSTGGTPDDWQSYSMADSAVLRVQCNANSSIQWFKPNKHRL